jgi:hypothetical protein
MEDSVDTQEGETTASTAVTAGGSGGTTCVQEQDTCINGIFHALEKLTGSGKEGAALDTTENEKPTGNMGAI